ncbi:hypothetical protein [Candidatus Pantoea deserta]|uniref:hypothetical protein n=1 Tax=Candidatus Pantoea deserta TaxID=1869313 RepID=UPI001319C297|nr:hypothetical protein [Pantoea deserta]
MLKPCVLLIALLLSGCAVTPHHQVKNPDAPPECRSHDSEIDCIWNDVPDSPYDLSLAG